MPCFVWLWVLVPIPPIVAVVLWTKQSEVLGDFGSLLGGYAALVAVIVAGIAGQREIAKWKERRIDEKRSDVAGEVYVAARWLASALETFASFDIQFWELTEPTNGASVIKALYAERIEPFNEARSAFRMASYRGASVLPDQSMPAIDSLRELAETVHKEWYEFARLWQHKGEFAVQRATEAQATVRAGVEEAKRLAETISADMRTLTLG
jgi:hypothetical protein